MIERIKWFLLDVLAKILATIAVMGLLPFLILLYSVSKEATEEILKAIGKAVYDLKDHKADEPTTPTDEINYHAKVFEQLATPIKKNK